MGVRESKFVDVMCVEENRMISSARPQNDNFFANNLRSFVKVKMEVEVEVSTGISHSRVGS